MTSQLSLLGVINNEEGLYDGNLAPYFVGFFRSSGILNPYHNFRHGTHTMWESYDGAAFHHLMPRKFRNSLIGGLKHDENHSGKIRGKDREEVATAVKSLRETILEEDRPELSEIEDLLWATEFPYTIAADQLTIGQKIIRDADMSQNFSTAWMQQSWLGLAQEMDAELVKFLKFRPEFLKSIVFHSAWGKQKFESRRQAAIDEAYGFIRMFEEYGPTMLKVA